MKNELAVREYLNDLLVLNSQGCQCFIRAETHPRHYQKAPHTPSCKENTAARHSIMATLAWILEEKLPLSQQSPEGNYVEMPFAGLLPYEPDGTHRHAGILSDRPGAVS